MSQFVDPVVLRKVLGEHLRNAIRSRGMSLTDAAKAVDVLPSSLQRYLSGHSLPRPETLIRIQQHFGVQLELHTDQFKVRQSCAASDRTCAICATTIRKGSIYFRDESTLWSGRPSSEPIRCLCRECIKPFQSKLYPPGIAGAEQLSLPFTNPLSIVRTRVELVDITDQVTQRIITHPNELYSITPRQFEDIVLDRLAAMELSPVRIGDTYRKDGGVDIVFCANRRAPFPFLGAVQVKYHRDPSFKVGPGPVRELGGVVSSMPFSAGLIVTNTSFTADAHWAARQQTALIRLRDFTDLIRWLSDNFTDDAEWREIPAEIEVCPGVRIPLTHLREH